MKHLQTAYFFSKNQAYITSLALGIHSKNTGFVYFVGFCLAINWIYHMLKNYIDLMKPERTLANVITAGAGFLLASRHNFDPWLFIAATTGLSLLVASACVLNNVIDKDLDKKMARTKKRALAVGDFPADAALLYSVLLGLAGIFILWASVNMLVVILGLIAYFDYIVLYGYTKRHTKYGTLVGTVCGALPMVAGYSAVTGSLDATALILYLSMTFWQMAHFYSIAIYRLKDYEAGGIPVWPAVDGIRATKIQIVVFTVAFLLASTSLSVFGPTGYCYAATMVAINAFWIRKGLSGWRTSDDAKWAKEMFKVSLNVLLTFAVAVSVGALLP